MGHEAINPRECENCWKEILDDVDAWVLYFSRSFCSTKCADEWGRTEAKKPCVMCNKNPKATGWQWCNPCLKQLGIIKAGV